jgi:hypothetical protein
MKESRESHNTPNEQSADLLNIKACGTFRIVTTEL